MERFIKFCLYCFVSFVFVLSHLCCLYYIESTIEGVPDYINDKDIEFTDKDVGEFGSIAITSPNIRTVMFSTPLGYTTGVSITSKRASSDFLKYMETVIPKESQRLIHGARICKHEHEYPWSNIMNPNVLEKSIQKQERMIRLDNFKTGVSIEVKSLEVYLNWIDIKAMNRCTPWSLVSIDVRNWIQKHTCKNALTFINDSKFEKYDGVYVLKKLNTYQKWLNAYSMCLFYLICVFLFAYLLRLSHLC